MTETVITRSEAETAALGRRLGQRLSSGAVVLLSGELGSGKTAFVRGLAEGIEANPDDVSSPTFTLVQEYRGGRLPLFHADLYRLTPREAEDIGLEELATSGGVTAIEWPDRLAADLGPAILVRIEHGSRDERAVVIEIPDALLTHSDR
jgi:tRNA threonylcarbamoyladenosine biosynthesis protein TsaE